MTEVVERERRREASPAEQQDQWPLLRELFAEADAAFEACYRPPNLDARRARRLLKIFSGAATVCGAIALGILFFTLTGLAPAEARPLLAWGEAVTASAALAIVGIGLWLRLPAKWLLCRNQAERCRLLRYRFLIRSVAAAPGETPTPAEALHQSLQELRKHQLSHRPHEPPAHWAEEALGSNFVQAADTGDIRREAVPRVRQAADYYLNRRLRSQRDWLVSRGQANESWDRFLRFLPPFFFFAGVLCALIHVWPELTGGHHPPAGGHEGGHSPSGGAHAADPLPWFAFLAAFLPVLGAVVRTTRLAFEFARNTSRYRAAGQSLTMVETLLERAVQEEDWPAVVRAMWASEAVLEAENREWVRLMMEADWYG